jgi:hypothetical protein
VTDRQLTSFITAHAVPPSQRNGPTGTFPPETVDLVDWVANFRMRGYRFSEINEMKPVWRELMDQLHAGALNLDALESSIATHITTLAVATALPALIDVCLAMHRQTSEHDVVLRDKAGISISLREAPVIEFVVRTPVTLAGSARAISHLALALDVQADGAGLRRIDIVAGTPLIAPTRRGRGRAARGLPSN